MTDERITAYLLQELTEEEAERFEEQCFAQEEWPADLATAEQELIDAYLRNELKADRRQRFEKNYLTSDARKARVLTAESFLHVLCPVPKREATFTEKLKAFWQRPLVPQAAVAILLLTISISVLWPLIHSGPTTQTVTRHYLAMSAPERGPGGQIEKIALPLNTDALELHLNLPEQSPDAVNYRVQWENVAGVVENLKLESQDAKSLVVKIPAGKLSPGQYVLKLFQSNRDGTERPTGNYFFTAEEAARTR